MSRERGQTMASREKVSRAACRFATPVEKFAEGEADNGKFRIVAYSGEVLTGHWYWGNLAFDLKGQKFAKSTTPILSEHLREMRIGFTTKQEISDKIIVEGTYLGNAAAQQAKSDIAEGFPMQASVYNQPDVVEHVEAGVSVEVNGRTLTGPGTVFRQATIREVSMCTLGFDGETEAVAAAEDKQEIQFDVVNKETDMSKTDEKLTLTAFAADHPDLKKEIEQAAFAAGGAEMLEQFGVFREKFGDCPAFVIEQFAKGASLMDATQAFAEKMKGERDAALSGASQAREEGESQTPPILSASKADPAVQEFSDLQGPPAASTDGLEGDEKYAAEFKADPEAREEFRGELDAYKAFRRNQDKGLIKIHRN